jgi:hypothetical protein
VIGCAVTAWIASTSPLVSRAPLTVGDQHAVSGDDEHVGGGELFWAGVKVFVGVDVLGDADRAGEVGQLQAARDRIGGADDRLLRDDDGRQCRAHGAGREPLRHAGTP